MPIRSLQSSRGRTELEVARVLEPKLGILGNVYFVDYYRGVDTSGYGMNIRQPFKTLEYAYAQCTDRNNDVIFLIATATSAAGTSCYVTTELVWAKHLTHLVGLGAGNTFNTRARIAHISTFTAAAGSLLTISGEGCAFKNVALYDGVTFANRYCVQVTGNRTEFDGVSIMGMGGALAAADAASASLYLNGAQVTKIIDSYIGLDTVARSAANSQVRMRGQASRTEFKNTKLFSYASAATPYFVDVNAASAVDRWTLFENCKFINAPTGLIGSAATLTTAFKVHASAGGYFLLDSNTNSVGCTKWDTDTTGKVLTAGNVPTGATSGLAVAVA